MNTREEFVKLYTLLLEANNVEQTLNKVGIYFDESVLINSMYGIFDIAITHLLSEEGLEVFYEEYLLTDSEIEGILEELDPYFL